MNTKHTDDTRDDLPDALRWQLRAMRRDEAPERDLWAGIAQRIQAQPRQVAPQRPRWIAPVAMAATLVLAVGMIGLWRDGAQGPANPGAESAPRETLVQLEAHGMQRQYQAAMIEVGPGRPPAELQPAFDELDRNAALILDALAHDPNSRLLLEQLRRTYARRLALAQRVAYA
ncbi:hypothetical protein [Lysobacter auxotrophicus]|uniref:DUF3379 domain-containing protein n=1 Tax=Lysobacter auxotrophicus TaxID=2992573 RepID=A0ABN6UMY8_9GAMM|nr:hypothetical protein [Lysobacter auxotrophicus]BDU17755.1 DUF3379 domain-containing protein [Lysobacter auxotrophicus]